MNTSVTKRGALCVAVGALLLSMAACSTAGTTATSAAAGSSPAASAGGQDIKTLKVGYSTKALRDVLLKTWAETTCKTVTDAGGTCTIADANNDAAKQVSDIQDLIAGGANFIVANPADAQAIVPAVKLANSKGIPFVTVDSSAAGGEILSAVHVDNAQAGAGAADFCVKQNPGDGPIEVAELQGMAGDANTIARHTGWADGLKKYPQLKEVFNQYTDWDAGKAEQAARDMINAHPDVKCVWTHADALALGAVRAIKAAGKTGVTVVGMGMYGGGPESIAAGELSASWYMEPVKTGQAAGQAAIDYWTKGTSQKDIAIQMTFVTKENVSDFPASS